MFTYCYNDRTKVQNTTFKIHDHCKSEAVNRRRTDYAMAKKKRYKRTNHDLQNTTQKTKDRVIRIPPKTGVNPDAVQRIQLSL
jgi:hypothetical protein